MYLFSLFAIPVFFEVSFLLNVWLREVPEYSIIFCQLILLNLFIEKFSFEITSAIRAVGIIRNFQIAETLIILLNVPLGFLVLSLGYPPYSIYYISICLATLIFCERLYFGKNVASLSLKEFFIKAVFPVLIPVFFSIIAVFTIVCFLDVGWFRLITSIMTTILILTSLFWFIGITEKEKNKIGQILEFSKKRITS